MDSSRYSTTQGRTLSSESSSADTSSILSIKTSEGAFGITTLREGPESPTVDIIAVHGLRADPILSWRSKKTGVMWLYDLLPNDLPNARIMTYGYNSRAVIDASTARIRDFALGLLNDLEFYRTKQERERPIIYICHSLGGLVVKQALVIANMDPLFQHLKTATHGIIFLGTPHCGSSTANVAIKFASIVKMLYPGVKHHVIQSLQSDSHELQYLSENFRHLHSQFELVSCYELQPKLMGMGLIVEKESALLSIEGERMIPLQADHSEIRRYNSASDPLYITVSGCIQGLAKNAPDATKAKFKIEKMISMFSRPFPISS